MGLRYLHSKRSKGALKLTNGILCNVTAMFLLFECKYLYQTLALANNVFLNFQLIKLAIFWRMRWKISIVIISNFQFWRNVLPSKFTNIISVPSGPHETRGKDFLLQSANVGQSRLQSYSSSMPILGTFLSTWLYKTDRDYATPSESYSFRLSYKYSEKYDTS